MSYKRRDLLKTTLFGASGLGLRALATGLPVGFLSRPLDALAEDYMCTDKTRAQYLILSTSSAGDPLNCNTPGTYDFPDIAHAADPRMAPTPLMLGGKSRVAAQLWSTLPPAVLNRMSFFHHGTYTNNHANLSKVLTLMGNTAKQEMLPSILSKYLAPCFGTVQAEPISAGAGDVLSFDGRSLPNVAPTGLRDLLARPNTPLQRLQTLRDTGLDQMHAILKDRGTKAQQLYLDSLALSRRQARALGTDLLDMLSAIRNDAADGQIAAAVALIKMNVSSVITIKINFGGDNHTDAGLARSEVPQHATAMTQITALATALQTAGLQDQVTFAAYNVFGRTLKKNGTDGRDHWGSHHTTIMFGKNIRAGVVGGLEPKSQDYYATPIDSKTGEPRPGAGDIPFTETLSAMAKTLGAACGVLPEVMDRHVNGGKVVTASVI
jgi:hypothetical protein